MSQSGLKKKLMIIELPFPPSINHYWKHRVLGRRAVVYLASEGVTFRQASQHCIPSVDAITERVTVTIDLYPPNKRKLDIDNRVKAVLDTLTHAGVWLDDEQVDRLIINRCEVTKGGAKGYCVVSIEVLK